MSSALPGRKLCRTCHVAKPVTDFPTTKSGCGSVSVLSSCRACEVTKLRRKKAVGKRAAQAVQPAPPESPARPWLSDRRPAFRQLSDQMRRAAVNGTKAPKSEAFFGYTPRELFDHIVARFAPGMTLEAFRRAEIHIDHITPVDAFDRYDLEDLRRAGALSNLRPLWGPANIAKGNTRLSPVAAVLARSVPITMPKTEGMVRADASTLLRMELPRWP